jgi:adenylate kinase family enzyme
MKSCRIHITGASGAGVTTLGRATADALAIPPLDTDDYFWRPTTPPYREKREIADRLRLMREMFLDGIIAGAEIGKRLGFENIISFGMGGTTAKASLIRSGTPTMSEGYYVGGYDSGGSVMVPVVDVGEPRVRPVRCASFIGPTECLFLG